MTPMMHFVAAMVSIVAAAGWFAVMAAHDRISELEKRLRQMIVDMQAAQRDVPDQRSKFRSKFRP